MKLVTKGDDFGFTRGVTLGIVDSIDRGILRNTGLFSNMPSAEFAVSFMKDRPQACFGIDINLVSGPCVSDPKDIPALVDENGNYIRSNIRIRDPRWQTVEGRAELFPYEQTYREVKAQVEKFIELTGGIKPGYIGGHSISSESSTRAMSEVAKEFGIVNCSEAFAKYGFVGLPRYSVEGQNKKEFNAIAQLEKDPEGHFWKNCDELLKHEYCNIGGHPGYIDNELLGLTSLSLERCKDAAWMMSEKVAQWVKDNNVELIKISELV